MKGSVTLHAGQQVVKGIFKAEQYINHELNINGNVNTEKDFSVSVAMIKAPKGANKITND